MTSLHGKLPLDDPRALPQEGMIYTDARGRTLYVNTVQLRDPLGREVVGLVAPAETDPEGLLRPSSRHYATDVSTWAHVWRDKAPPADRATMKVGG